MLEDIIGDTAYDSHIRPTQDKDDGILRIKVSVVVVVVVGDGGGSSNGGSSNCW